MTSEFYCNVYPKDCEDPPRMCCKAYNAKCMSCMEGITEAEYCAKYPGRVGCPVIYEPSERMCCMAMTPSCLACSAGLTVDQYCAKNPGYWGCPGCCEALTAECLACSAGLSTEEYCTKFPDTSGCNPQDSTVPIKISPEVTPAIYDP